MALKIVLRMLGNIEAYVSTSEHETWSSRCCVALTYVTFAGIFGARRVTTLCCRHCGVPSGLEQIFHPWSDKRQERDPLNVPLGTQLSLKCTTKTATGDIGRTQVKSVRSGSRQGIRYLLLLDGFGVGWSEV